MIKLQIAVLLILISIFCQQQSVVNAQTPPYTLCKWNDMLITANTQILNFLKCPNYSAKIYQEYQIIQYLIKVLLREITWKGYVDITIVQRLDYIMNYLSEFNAACDKPFSEEVSKYIKETQKIINDYALPVEQCVDAIYQIYYKYQHFKQYLIDYVEIMTEVAIAEGFCSELSPYIDNFINTILQKIFPKNYKCYGDLQQLIMTLREAFDYFYYEVFFADEPYYKKYNQTNFITVQSSDIEQGLDYFREMTLEILKINLDCDVNIPATLFDPDFWVNEWTEDVPFYIQQTFALIYAGSYFSIGQFYSVPDGIAINSEQYMFTGVQEMLWSNNQFKYYFCTNETEREEIQHPVDQNVKQPQTQ